MFGITLICESVNREPGHVDIKMRQAGTDLIWFIGVPEVSPHIAQLVRPGACFALVELASVAQVESRGKF
jgi:hypothetical protein